MRFHSLVHRAPPEIISQIYLFLHHLLKLHRINFLLLLLFFRWLLLIFYIFARFLLNNTPDCSVTVRAHLLLHLIIDDFVQLFQDICIQVLDSCRGTADRARNRRFISDLLIIVQIIIQFLINLLLVSFVNVPELPINFMGHNLLSLR